MNSDVDYAELIWRKLEGKGITQQNVADELGWGRVDVARYKALECLKTSGAWDVIVPTFNDPGTSNKEDEGTTNVPTGTTSTFTERLLRDILDLTPVQQIELCGYLAKGKDKKGHAYTKAKFKQDAIWYRGFNVLLDLVDKRITAKIPEPACNAYIRSIHDELKKNSEYGDEYLKAKKPGDKFEKLIQAAIDDWEKKNNIKIIVKDVRDLTADDIADNSIDCLITDPPYPKDYIDLFDDLGALAAMCNAFSCHLSQSPRRLCAASKRRWRSSAR